MAKQCVREQSARRQRWIEEGLLEMMMECRFEEITVTDLCRRLGLSRRSFYRYFQDTEDVLNSLLEHTFQEFVIPDAPLSLSELERNFRFWMDRRDLLQALAVSGMSGRIMEYTMRYTETRLPAAYFGLRNLDGDWSRETHLFVVGGLVSMIVAWHLGGFRKTPEEMARIALRMLTEPILALD